MSDNYLSTLQKSSLCFPNPIEENDPDRTTVENIVTIMTKNKIKEISVPITQTQYFDDGVDLTLDELKKLDPSTDFLKFVSDKVGFDRVEEDTLFIPEIEIIK